MYVVLTCHPLQKMACAKITKFFTINQDGIFFIAEVQNTPAGIGVLYINNGIASLAASATLPEFQRKGCHTALIQKRLETAIESNCHLIVGQAKFGSGSQNNMERAHMKIAYTKSIWTAKDM